jgi:hypothetical protein
VNTHAPEAFHICDRCGEAASGPCETCAGLDTLARREARELVRAGVWKLQFDGDAATPAALEYRATLQHEFTRQWKEERERIEVKAAIRRAKEIAQGLLIVFGFALSGMAAALALWAGLRWLLGVALHLGGWQ